MSPLDLFISDEVLERLVDVIDNETMRLSRSIRGEDDAFVELKKRLAPLVRMRGKRFL